MGKRLWMRTVALGLAVCVWLSGCGLGEDGGLEPTEQTFSQIEYQRPDGDAVLEQIQVAQVKQKGHNATGQVAAGHRLYLVGGDDEPVDGVDAAGDDGKQQCKADTSLFHKQSSSLGLK